MIIFGAGINALAFVRTCCTFNNSDCGDADVVKHLCGPENCAQKCQLTVLIS